MAKILENTLSAQRASVFRKFGHFCEALRHGKSCKHHCERIWKIKYKFEPTFMCPKCWKMFEHFCDNLKKAPRSNGASFLKNFYEPTFMCPKCWETSSWHWEDVFQNFEHFRKALRQFEKNWKTLETTSIFPKWWKTSSWHQEGVFQIYKHFLFEALRRFGMHYECHFYIVLKQTSKIWKQLSCVRNSGNYNLCTKINIYDCFDIIVWGQSTFFIMFRAHMDPLFIIKVNVLVPIKWSYRSLQLCWPLYLDLLSII